MVGGAAIAAAAALGLVLGTLVPFAESPPGGSDPPPVPSAVASRRTRAPTGATPRPDCAAVLAPVWQRAQVDYALSGATPALIWPPDAPAGIQAPVVAAMLARCDAPDVRLTLSCDEFPCMVFVVGGDEAARDAAVQCFGGVTRVVRERWTKGGERYDAVTIGGDWRPGSPEEANALEVRHSYRWRAYGFGVGP